MKESSDRKLLFTLGLAFVFWYLIFGVKLLNFWLSMAIAVPTLATFAWHWGGIRLQKSDSTWHHLLLGIGSAALLYGIFWVGNSLSQLLFHFAKPEIASIYDIRNEGQALGIGFILFFITSPCEEFFWRAYVQGWATQRFGGWQGWLIGAAIYGSVHILSGNFMLTLAALIAGLFWGLLYWRTHSLFTCIISHACWTVAIFILWPIL